MRITIVSDIGGFESLKKDWNALLASSSSESVFLRWEWIFEWWKAYRAADMTLAVLLVYGDEGLAGVGPFYVESSNAAGVLNSRRLRFLGTAENSAVSEYLDIICLDRYREGVARAIFDFIEKEDLCSEMTLQMLPASSETVRLLRERAMERSFFFSIARREKSPYINLPSTNNAFLEGLRPSLSGRIRNNRNRLAAHCRVEYRKTSGLHELEADFSELVRLHQLRWTRRNMPGAFSDARFIEFQRSVMRELLKDGLLDLHFLSANGSNIAALYNITCGEKVYFYQSGVDTAFRKNVSPGMLLHARCIAEAIDKGMREYDFLLNGALDRYKWLWTDTAREMIDLHIARPGIAKLAGMAKKTIRGIYISING